MRELNTAQKRLIDTWLEDIKELITIEFDCLEEGKNTLFPFELYEQIESINDFETINQEINNYVIDKAFES